MRLEMSGRFHQIAKFAYELGKVDRIINVENIELTEPKVVGDEMILKGQVPRDGVPRPQAEGSARNMPAENVPLRKIPTIRQTRHNP